MARILVIDDEADLVEICRMIFEAEGHSVATVLDANRTTLLETVRSFRPDLIFLDLVMPDVAGDEVHGWLRSLDEARGTPIVITSALANAAARASQLGADGFVAKPFTDDELIAAAEAHVNRGPGQL